tara:strand:- start:2564 stop:3217 length:654 start_codon:yes stop_codon:yes gene_type:complete
MDFFLDSAETQEISKFHELGMINGVTTNPSLIYKSNKPFRELVTDICAITNGPVSVEVTSSSNEKMVEEGFELAKMAGNVVVKLPMTWEGIKACITLSENKIPVNVTLCFSSTQAILAAKAGATYVSPFIGRLDDSNIDGIELIREIKTIYTNYNFTTKILAASVRTKNHITQSAIAGADIATIPPNLFHDLAKHHLTDKGLETFNADWEKSGQKIL